MNILIVRLGALGDIVHAVPAAAALRHALPTARIDWLVDAKHRQIVELVTAIDRVVALQSPTLTGWTDVLRELRRTSYDVAIDLQGLLKSAVLARGSGASRIVGFSIWHLREKAARPFYSDVFAAEGGHVIARNLRLLRAIGVADEEVRFPFAEVPSPALDTLRQRLASDRPFALLNAGAAWPNKRWPADRFGELASFIRDDCGMTPVVLWGPGEERLVDDVIAASSNAAVAAPPTGVADLIAIARASALVVSGDTGPLHIATAVGTPAVGIFGPTDPARNGPFAAGDVTVSRFDACGCHYDRRCHQSAWCLADVTVAEVAAAVKRRLAASRDASPSAGGGSGAPASGTSPFARSVRVQATRDRRG
jgi:lipopolysaccharide heptosyltransferase I